jgi:hypothetical protein
MSGAFVRESDDQWLSDVGPSINALVNFLTRENNGVRVNLLKTDTDHEGRELFFMSNGLTYFKSKNSTWTILENSGT